MIRLLNRRHLRAVARRFLARHNWLVRQPSGGESRDVWKVGPLCVKRWQSAISVATVRAKCCLSRQHPNFARRWYLPWLHWSIGRWMEGRQADFEECNALACRHPWAHDLNPSNVIATPCGLKIIDYEVVDWPPDLFRPDIIRRVGAFVRIARLPGGGESRDILKLGPLCVKRWSPRVSPAEARLRCRVSREIPVCNPMRYVPWLHWTIARWVIGKPATHEACNRLLARFPVLRDLHPGNVVVGRRGAVVVVDFGVRARCDRTGPAPLFRDEIKTRHRRLFMRRFDRRTLCPIVLSQSGAQDTSGRIDPHPKTSIQTERHPATDLRDQVISFFAAGRLLLSVCRL